MPAATVPDVVHSLDVSALRCPMTWVRTKLELDRLHPVETLEVHAPARARRWRTSRARRARPATPWRRRHDRQDRARMSEGVAARASSATLAGRGRAAALAGAEPRPVRARRRAAAQRGRDRALLAPARCCPSGPSWRRSRCATRACWWSARARSARRWRCTSRARASAGSGIVDSDVVEISNLHRQPLHFTPDVGVPKAESAAAKLRFLNPDVVVEPYQVRLDETNAAGLVEGQDLVIDCSDSFATRYAVNAGLLRRRAWTSSRAARWAGAGLVMTILPRATACYRCAFPVEPDGRAVVRARPASLGPAAGVIGSLQALEAIKLLTGAQPPLWTRS